MGFTGAHVLYVLDVFILALYLLSHVCALLEYTFQPKASYTPLSVKICFLLWKFQIEILKIFIIFKISEKKFPNLEFFSKISNTTKGPPMTSKGPPPPY